MRFAVSLGWCGYELDFSLGPADTGLVADDEPEFEPYQDAGTTGSYPIGYAPSPQPEWVRPLNRYDEPSEDTEDV